MSESTENIEEFSLKSFNYKLKKRPVSKGSIGSLWLVTHFCFQNVDHKSPFGEKFMKLESKLQPLLNSVNNLFVDFYSENGYMGDMIYTIFLDDFRGKSFIKGSTRDHLNVNLVTAVECLLHRLRYWQRRLDNNGWNGKYWSQQIAFKERLDEILSLVPEQVEETFLVRLRENNDDENVEMNNEVDQEFDDTKFKTVHKYVEPLVKEIEDVVREATFAQRQANNKNPRQENNQSPKKQSKYVRGKQQREMKRNEKQELDKDWKDTKSKNVKINKKRYSHIQKKWSGKTNETNNVQPTESDENNNKFNALTTENVV